MIKYETTNKNEIICPFCGYEHRNSYEKVDNEDEDTQEIECSKCGKEIKVWVEIYVKYSSQCKNHDFQEIVIPFEGSEDYLECTVCGQLCKKLPITPKGK